MSRLLRAVALCCTLACLLSPSSAQTPRTIRFAGEEWPPFLGRELPGDGLHGALLQAVFSQLGYTARIDYFPWKRAMELGLHDARYAGLVAVWRTPEREKLCHFSAPVGTTQTVLAYLKDKPVRAAALDQLRGQRLGIVAGYAYGDGFEAGLNSGRLEVEEGVNDETNVRKLLIGRFPAILVERRVLRHILGGFAPAERERIAVDERLFRERPIHLCFRRTPAGELQQRAFNDAAREVDLERVEREYWRRVERP